MDIGPFQIYYVFSPDQNQDGPRYIGMHTGPMGRRISEHLSEARSGKNTHKCNWIRKVLASGQEPVFEVISIFESREKMVKAEIDHIAYWRLQGANLTNATNGGEGMSGYKVSDETKSKQSIAHSGKFPSIETRAKMRASHLANPPTDEHVKKLVALTSERNRTVEHRAKVSAGLMGHVVSEDTRAKIGAASLGRIHTEKSKAKVSKAVVDQNGVVYPSVIEAARQLGLHHPNICKVLKGKNKHAGGYTFTYLTPDAP